MFVKSNMVIKKRVLWFKVISFFLEDIHDTKEFKKKYSKIFILSYNKLDVSDFSVGKKKTPLIYLSKEKEEIFKNFNDTARKKIRRSERNNELRFVVNDNNFEEAYRIYADHVYAYGKIPDRKKEMEDMKIFSAYHKDEMIAAIICYDSPKFLRAKAICSKRFDVQNKEKIKLISIASCRLVWEICRYGIDNKYEIFDLGSINIKDESRAGAAQFKKSFNVDIIDEYYYVYKSPFFKFLQKFVFIKIYIYKFLKKLK